MCSEGVELVGDTTRGVELEGLGGLNSRSGHATWQVELAGEVISILGGC
jgi:hypothetical protein